MKGDFSRLTFDARKHFSRVLQQQGRVQLDADWNEQTAILLHHLQTTTHDLVGNFGGPKDLENSDGGVLQKRLGFEPVFDANRIEKFFELSDSEREDLKNILTSNSASSDPLVLSKGRYYVDGILTEADNFFGLYSQPDYPWPENERLGTGTYLLYLDVWERHISALEDNSIREVALNGPDTTTRSKIVWQVKATNKNIDGINNTESPRNTIVDDGRWDTWKKSWQPDDRGRLKVRAKHDPHKACEPCTIAPESSYRGLENQLYRVEIHNSGAANSATFKWARDNASAAAEIKTSGTVITLDQTHGFSAGQWVELTSDAQELRGFSGHLYKIKKIEGTDLFIEESAITTPADVAEGEAWPTKARRWDGAETKIKETSGDQWLSLADGVQIQFQSAEKREDTNPQHYYRSGDYWLIPVRTATGDVEWPSHAALPPQGVEHHYAPLAIIDMNSQNTVNNITDLRYVFEGLAKPITPAYT